MRTKNRLLAMLATLAAVSLTPITASAAPEPYLGISNSTELSGGKPSGQKIGDLPKDFEALPAANAEPQSNCPRTKDDLKALRDAGQDKAVCVEWQTPQEFAKTQKTAAASAANAVWCSAQPQNTVYVERTSICSKHGVVIIVKDTTTGMIYGKAYGTIQQEIDTQNANAEFIEYMSFNLTSSDVTSSVMTVQVDSTCSLDTSCKDSASAWGTPRPITVGGSLDGTMTRRWTGAKGRKSFLIDYTLKVKIGGGSGYAEWGGDGQPGDGQYLVRCDNEVTALIGCVVPSYTPTFVVDDKYSEAKQFIGMVQASTNLHPGWEGKGQPLHREADPAEVNKNRAVICDSTFKPASSTPNPQCDEFPFARSKESGRRLGVLSGGECQQYSVLRDSITGGLRLYWPGLNQGQMPNPNAKCGRASMPKVQNEGVGGDLGRKTAKWRLLDGDAYWVDAGQPVG
ncbi:hypothetical protein [Streptomyces ardesiacus]|uniref:hypothetical protein n=1 Tax=Streptomyces ardesiacus TaxID=285564 RepID=UPI003655192D